MNHRIVILVTLLLAQTGFAQPKTIIRLDGKRISFAAIDAKVKTTMQAAGVQGVSIAVLNNNKTVFIRSYGLRDKRVNAPLDTASIVYGASLSKAVFGWLVMSFVQERRFDLDKPLCQYLKKPISEYPYFADLQQDERWKRITGRMCLSHTTGLPNVRWFNPITGEPDSLGTMKLYFTPGTQYAYSGEGFKLLQLVIEEITGRETDELATERIFLPFRMTRTGYVWHHSFGDDNVAVGHLANGDIDQKRKRTESVAGGSLVTTIADFARFVEQVMRRQGLSQLAYREMLSPQIAIHSKTQFPPVSFETTTENDAIQLSYGLGWGLFKCGGGRVFFKEGNGGSWRNYNVNFPDKGISLIILANSENGEKMFRPLVELIVGESCIPWRWEGY